MHPLTENLVLGFGAEVDPVSDQQKGLQLSLFDVSDPSLPTLLQRQIIGGVGSYSPLLHDHHAFSILPAGPDRPLRIGIPVALSELAAGGQSSWIGSGLARFEVEGLDGPSMPRLIWSDTLFAARSQTGDQAPSLHSGRGLLNDANSYLYLSDGRFFSAPWGGDQAVGPF